MATAKELAIEAAKRIRGRMTHKARYMSALCELRRGESLGFGDIEVKVQQAPMEPQKCGECGTRLPAGPERGPGTVEFVDNSATAIIDKYFQSRIDAIVAEIDETDIITFDLPVPNGLQGCDLGEYGGISVRAARIYDVAYDAFLMRFDVLYCEDPQVALPIAA